MKEYFPRLREIADEHNILLITDEVMSGWGRTGTWFAIDNWRVKPDILTTAKGSTSAYTPLGITATTKKIADYFEENYFAHGHTYEAHPLAMAPLPAVIEEYKRLNILQNVKRQGAHLGKRLNEIKERHVSVGDVRGIGLFWGVELVKNRRTKKPFNTPKEKFAGQPLMVDRVAAELFNKGVSLMSWISHFVIGPPLIITEEQIDQGVDALDQALKIADTEVDQ